MLRAGIKASAVWGYLTTMLAAADATTGGGSGSQSSSSASGEPGEWQPENQSGWSSMTADVYQAQITGRHGMCYVVKGVKFDGWDLVRRVLLGAKDNYAFLLKENGQWRDWYNPTEWQEIAKHETKAAAGIPIEWHFAQKQVADAVRPLVGDKVRVVYTPPRYAK
jgi:hypothetical protein